MSALSFSKKIALRYLWTKRSEAFISIITIISIIGLTIGVLVINMVMAIMTGFEFELRNKILGTTSHVVVRKLGGRIYDWHNVVDSIGKISGVSAVSPFTYSQALVRTEAGASGVLIRGITEGSFAAQQLGQYMKDGQEVVSLFHPQPLDLTTKDSTTLPAIVIGRELARTMGLTVGEPVALLSSNVSPSPLGLVPKFRRFVIAGTYSSGLTEYESGLAYMDLTEAQKFFRLGDAISGIEIRVSNVDEAPRIARGVLNKLGGFSEGFYVQDWTEMNRPLWDALRLEKRVYFIVLLLIIVMASFSIVTTLIMIVIEKRKDIAVLKTIGATSKAITSVFKIQGAVIGAIGTVLGTVGGYIGCLALRHYGFPIDERIFQMSTVPVKLDPMNFLMVAGVSFIISFLATIYPAYRANKLEPVEILRYE